MRLTLRTLLAYMDDILEPSDKEQLSKKIEASEFAADLMHRTRDTVRRLRLGAPQVIGSGMGLDPNTVAEYLDNVLPPESVGDFERICLESDMHLAEAAACHHVLTMVLGEPAEVDPIARQRMYSIPSEIESRRQMRVEAAHPPLGAAPRVSPSAPLPAMPFSEAPMQASVIMEVPDYLRASSWSGYRRMFAGLAGLLIVGAGALYFSGWRPATSGRRAAESVDSRTAIPGPTDDASPPFATMPAVPASTVPDETPAGTQASDPSATVAVPPFAANTDQEVELPTKTASPPPSLAADQPPQPVTPGIDSGPALSSTAPTAIDDAAAATSPPPAGNEAAAATTGDVAVTEPAIDEPEMTQLPPGSPAAQTEATVPPLPNTAAASQDVATVTPPNLVPEPTAPAVPDSNTIAANTEIAKAADNALARSETPVASPASDVQLPATEHVPEGPVEVGTYLGGSTILLRFDEQAGAWFRVGPRLPIIEGDRLTALPEYRPRISLLAGLDMDVSGGTQVLMQESTADSSPAAADTMPVGPSLEIVYGRIVLSNSTDNDVVIRLQLGASSGEAVLAGNAKLAVEVERRYVPGHDPRQSASPVIASLYAPQGGVRWSDSTGTLAADGPSQWSIVDGTVSPPQVDNSSPPGWIDAEPVGPLSEQRFAAPKIEAELDASRPVDVQLLELFHGARQREIRSLVAKCCIHIGEFAPFIDALRDSDQKANWSTHIDLLRVAMALSTESALGVKKAIDEQRGQPAADDLYEMLCGYNESQIGLTPPQVQTGAISRLIDWLEEDSLDYRVLAVHNLFEITGKRLMADPSASRNERARNVKAWRGRLENNDVLPAKSK